MSEYNRSKTFEIPEICFRNRPDLQSKRERPVNLNLRETIDTSSLRYEFKANNRYRPSFTESLRHTTSHNSSLTDLLGNSNTQFEAKTGKEKYSQYKKSTFDDLKSESITSKVRPTNYTMNSTWSDFKHRSYKDLSNIQKQEIDVLDRQMKQKYLYNNNSYKDVIEQKSPIYSPIRKQSHNDESPHIFSKKPSYYYSPSDSEPKEDHFQTASTRFGTPMSCKQIKQKQPKSPNSFTVLRKKSTLPTFITAPKLDDFQIIKHLGEGRFGAVSMAIHKKTGLLVALKKVKKQVIKAHKIQNQFVMQLKMQLIFKHANVLGMYGYFDNSQHIYLILEYMQQGTLFGQLKKQKHLTQKDAARKMADVLNGVQYLHDMQIAHRDIKPQNIVLSNGVCKLCDFGWATKCDNRRTTLCGTIDYSPPEVLQGKQYGISMDLWCLGVLCYQLLIGKAPFYHISRKQTMQKIIKADTSDLKIPQNISENAIDFINKLLLKNPQERMSCQEALRHKFILQNLDEDNESLRTKKK